jgi:hypothetical protein
MTAAILPWPSRLDGAKDWSQGLWRAQVDGRVVEFTATKPCADWPVARAALLEQLQTALAAGAVTVIEGPPLEPPAAPALVVAEPADPRPLKQPEPVAATDPAAAGPVLAVPRSKTRLGLVGAGRADEGARRRIAFVLSLREDGQVLWVDQLASAAPGRHELRVPTFLQEQLLALDLQQGQRVVLTLDEQQHPATVLMLIRMGPPPRPAPDSPG